MTQAPIRTLLVDDHAVVRSGYRTYLHAVPGFEVVGEAGTADDAYGQYKLLQPDIVIMDIVLPGASGIDATRRILAFDRNARILVFSMHSTPIIVKQVLDVGALGMISKDSLPETLCKAAATVAAGRRYLDGNLAKAVVLSQYRQGPKLFEALSPREFDIVLMLVAGMLPGHIAESLNLSTKTVANALSAVRTKLGVSSDIQLVKLAASAGLVPWIVQREQSENDE